jgi:hypothetical protein
VQNSCDGVSPVTAIFFGACEKRPSVSLFWKEIQSFTHVNSFHTFPKCLTADHFWQARLGGISCCWWFSQFRKEIDFQWDLVEYFLYSQLQKVIDFFIS